MNYIQKYPRNINSSISCYPEQLKEFCKKYSLSEIFMNKNFKMKCAVSTVFFF